MDLKMKELLDTTSLSASQIWKMLGYGSKTGRRAYLETYTAEQRSSRHKRILAEQKFGDRNPMFGKTGESHPNFRDEVSDGKGYIMVLKPEWYTGRVGSKHVFKHHVVMCESLNLTEMPSGWVVHHIDGDKANNCLSNLALMTVSAHNRLHQLERATTIPKGSRK